MVPDQAAQSAMTRRAEAEIRGFLEEKGIARVPADLPHYVDLPVPPYLEALDGFGEWTLFPNTARPGEPSIRWIPKPSPKLGYFAGSMARDRRPHMSHEGIPGHAFQLALASRHEDEIRREFYDSGPIEGLAFYSEELLLSAGLYADAPKAREMVANYMRLRALRVEVDVKLALGTFTIPEAAEYLRTASRWMRKPREPRRRRSRRRPGRRSRTRSGSFRCSGSSPKRRRRRATRSASARSTTSSTRTETSRFPPAVGAPRAEGRRPLMLLAAAPGAAVSACAAATRSHIESGQQTDV